MGKGYNLLEKLNEARLEGIRIGFALCQQEMSDLIQLTLNDKEVMGKDVFGPARLTRVLDGLSRHYQFFRNAWAREVDTDYLRQKLDDRLKPIWGEAFLPFTERYEMLYKEEDYSKRFKARR